jgi:hypothetical protein
MRWLIVLGVLLAAQVVRADEKALHAFDGKLVITRDAPPSTMDELSAFVSANIAKDNHYALTKGAPWEVHVIAPLAKDVTPLALTFVDIADKKQAVLQTIDVTARRRVVNTHFKATTAAGFEPNKTYMVTLVSKSTVLARAELELRD